MDSPKLSIITICKNNVSEIEDTCISISGQTFKDFEWIVIDGGSTDGTLELLKKYADERTILVSEPDSGIYNAINKGIRLARGKRLLFLDGGDFLASNNVLAEVFSRELRADVCYGDVYHLDPADDSLIFKEECADAQMSKLYLAFHTISHSSAFVRRELFERYGLYDENFRMVSDWEKWIVFFENGCSFSKLDVTVSVFRLGGVSSTQTKLQDEECAKVQERYFTTDEIECARKIVKCETLLSWGGGGAVSIMEREGMRIYSFMHIPLLKVRLKRDAEIYRLFGIIPLWKIRKKRKYRKDILPR